MKKSKKFLLIIMIICSIVFAIEPVYAESCNYILTEGAYQLLQDALNVIRIAVPALLIILCSVDLGTAVVSDDKDALKKSTSKVMKRVLAAIAVFFVPLIVNVLINMVESTGAITIVEDPLCGLK